MLGSAFALYAALLEVQYASIKERGDIADS